MKSVPGHVLISPQPMLSSDKFEKYCRKIEAMRSKPNWAPTLRRHIYNNMVLDGALSIGVWSIYNFCPLLQINYDLFSPLFSRKYWHILTF